MQLSGLIPLKERKKLEQFTTDSARERYRRWRKRSKESKAYIAILFSMCEGECPICGRSMILTFDKSDAPNLATLDHVVPLSETKTHDKMNLMIMCRECNGRKGSDTK